MQMLLQAAALSDTLIVRQVPQVRTGFEQFVFVASGLTTLLTLVLLVVVLVALIAMRKKTEETSAKIDALLQDVQATTTQISTMVSESRETVHAANLRIRQTVDTLADRVDELSDMIGSVNRSAARVATIASTAIGGIKLGAKAFGIGRGKKKKGRDRDLARDERPRLRRRD